MVSDDGLFVRTLAVGYPANYRTGSHAHDWHQLVFATRGALAVHAPAGTWVVPASRAVWIAAGERHEVETIGPADMRTIYVAPESGHAFPDRCLVLDVSPLVRELILHVCELGMLTRTAPEHDRLVGVLADQLRRVSAVPLELPMPSDDRALAAARRVLDARDDEGEDPFTGAGASRRTLERLFAAETGMTLGRWRRRARLLRALRLLASGRPVTTVALEVGYASTSAFISMFRRELGSTPSRYYAADD